VDKQSRINWYKQNMCPMCGMQPCVEALVVKETPSGCEMRCDNYVRDIPKAIEQCNSEVAASVDNK
jgi:hypothetical protein